MVRSPDEPLSPFALTPSAPPPSVNVKPAPVRVPPPALLSPAAQPPSDEQGVRLEPFVEAAPRSSVEAVLPAITTTPQAEGGSLQEERPQRRRVPLSVIGAGVGALLVGSGLVVGQALLKRSVVKAKASSVELSPSGVPTTSSASVAPMTSASAAVIASVVPAMSSSSSPPALRQPFDSAAARAAVADVAPTLTECKLRKGSSVRVKVTFAPDGNISSAVALAPYKGRQAACIVSHVRAASMPPFQGIARSSVYTLTVPR